jgi:hypothetical protein
MCAAVYTSTTVAPSDPAGTDTLTYSREPTAPPVSPDPVTVVELIWKAGVLH